MPADRPKNPTRPAHKPGLFPSSAAPLPMVVFHPSPSSTPQGVYRGLQDTRTPLYATLASNGLNILINWVLIFGCHMGVQGAALGTVVSQVSHAARRPATQELPPKQSKGCIAHGCAQQVPALVVLPGGGRASEDLGGDGAASPAMRPYPSGVRSVLSRRRCKSKLSRLKDDREAAAAADVRSMERSMLRRWNGMLSCRLRRRLGRQLLGKQSRPNMLRRS